MTSTSRGRILIVDDEPFNVDYLEQELADLHYETISAVNGQEALEKIRAAAPDLVLLDIRMPIMDGFTVLEHAKADPATRDIPIIVISANNDLQSVIKGIQRGAEDYLPKPFEPTLLAARIAASLEKKILRDQQRKLLHTFASDEVAEELLASGFSLGGKIVQASIMFTDIRSFTTYTESHDAAEVVSMLNDYFAAIFTPISKHGGVVNQIIGDGLMAMFGITQGKDDHRHAAVLAATEMISAMRELNQQRLTAGKTAIQIGIGIASGDVMAGYAGTQHRATYTCVGDAVNLGARIEKHTKVAGRPILIDSETKAGLPESLAVESLGPMLFKGKTTPVEVYAVGDVT